MLHQYFAGHRAGLVTLVHANTLLLRSECLLRLQCITECQYRAQGGAGNFAAATTVCAMSGFK